jgi:hypothetical protein
LLERYKDRLIVALAIPAREDTGKYLSVASISWDEDGGRTSHVLYKRGDRYKDRNWAISSAIAAAEKWIDGREEEKL